MITANELIGQQPIQQKYKEYLTAIEGKLIEANKRGDNLIDFEIEYKPKNDMIELSKYLESLGYKVVLTQPEPPFRGHDYAYTFEIRW